MRAAHSRRKRSERARGAAVPLTVSSPWQQHQRRRWKTRSRRLAPQPNSRPRLTERRPEPPLGDPHPPAPPSSSSTSSSSLPGLKEGKEVLLPRVIIPSERASDRRRHGLPVKRRRWRGEAGGRAVGGGRRQRSSKREKERLKPGTKAPHPPLPPPPPLLLLLLLPQLAPSPLPPPPPWVPPATVMGTPHQMLQPPLCPWAMSWSVGSASGFSIRDPDRG